MKKIFTIISAVIIAVFTTSNQLYAQCGAGQSELFLTTSGGSYTTEKWVDITTGANSTGTTIWAQGNGTYGNGAGLVTSESFCVDNGVTYYINAYDKYADSWDGTTYLIEDAYSNVVANNGGVSPDDGTNLDASSSWGDTQAQELEVSEAFSYTPITCPAPTSLAAGSITTTQASLSWTESGSATQWDIELGLNGFSPTGTPTQSGVTNPYTYTGLSASTTYEYYVRADCGGSDYSTWVGPFQFSTACGAVSSFPWTETFETSSGTLPCWTVDNNNADSDEWDIQTSSTYANNGDQSYQIYTDYNSGSNDDYLISPAIVLTGNEQLRFYERVRSSSEPNDFEVLLSTTGTDPSDFTTTLLSNTSYSNTTYEEIIINLSSYSGTVYIAIHVPNGGLDGWYLYIDDFTIEAIPACPTPTDLAAGSIIDTQASLSWTENGSSTSWDIELGASGFTPTGTPTQSGVTNPYTYTGLTSSTTYEYYVRAFCGGSDYSTWSGPFEFSTTCGIYTPTYYEDFACYLPDCWSETDGTLAAPSTLSGTTSYWTEDGFANSGTTGAARLNIYGTERDDWLISPSIDLGDGSIHYQLELDIALTDYGSTSSAETDGTDDKFAIIISTDNGSTWTSANTLMLWDNVSSPNVYNDISTTGEHIVINLTSYTGIIQIGLYGESTVSNADNDLFVDNFKVIEIPLCPNPYSLTATNVIFNQADLSWTEGGSSTQWDIELGLSGFSPSGTPTQSGVTTNPYTYTGLSSETVYEYYVRAFCGGSDYSSWVGPYEFTTPCEGISGSVNVGSGQTYESLTGTGGLFEKINECGLTGDLTANITSDLTEDGTNALNEWTGTYTLTIQPSAATVRDISGSVSDEMIRFDGADNVTINGNYSGSGEYLHFENTNSSYPVIQFLNDAQGNTIQNASIEGGSYGVYYYYCDEGTNTLNNCSVYDFDDYGVYSYYCDGTFVISENEIYQTSQKSGTCYAIRLYYSENNTVEKNHIYNIQSASSYSAYGIYVYYSNADIRNNMIALSPSNNYYVYGIYYSGSTSYTNNIYFNSIYIGGSGSSSYNTYGVYKTSSASAFNFKNNIIFNDRTASTSNQYAVYFSSSTGINSENNQLYASNATYGYAGYWISTACQTLSEYQVASSQDAYSYEIEPTFSSSTDLHIAAGTGMVGTMITGITDDIDGEARTSPAIGADEIAIPPCSGTPNAGTASISSSIGCMNVDFTITVSGLSVEPGISYQWQSSADGSSGWSDISGATSPNYTTSITTTTYYRLVSTCSYSTLTNNSNVVSYTVTGDACSCGNYSSTYATSTGDEDMGNVTVGSLDNSSTMGELAGGTGSVAYEYGNYTGVVSAPDIQQLESVSFSLTSLDDGDEYHNGFQIYIDYNQDGDFSDAGEQAYSSDSEIDGGHTETGSFIVPITALTGITRMRVVCVETTFPTSSNYAETSYSWGETEDYCVNITPAPDCSGTPNAGTASISSSSGCSNTSFDLSATGVTGATGISYQWQSSANGSTGWADISGATGVNYSTTATATTYYRLVTTCSLSSESNVSNIVSYTVTGNACVCSDYYENYTNYYSTDEDIGNVTVGTLNNSSTLGELAGGDGSVAYEYSNYAGIISAPDLQQLANISFSLTSIISSGSYANGFQIYIDYDQNGTFSSDEKAYSSTSSTSGAHTETGSFIIPISAETGITRMRVICMQATFPTSTNYAETNPYDYGETEDYCVNITPAPDCSGTPNAGTASIDLTTGCASTYHTVSATGVTAATGITYQWQYSLDGSTGWTDIPDENDLEYSTSADVTTYYRLVTTCSNSGLSNQTNVVSYTVTEEDCCVSTLYLYDEGGDGWDGGYVTVSVGGVEIGDYDLNSGSGPEIIYITTDEDEAISIVYTDGTDYDENYFDLIGPEGTYYAEDWYPTDYSSTYDGPWNGRGCPIPQPGDMCDMSIAFCTGTNYSFPTGVDNPPAPEGPEYGCLYTQPNPVYYFLRVDQPGAMEILIESDCGDVDFAAWGPFDATTCDPADLTANGNPGTGGNYDQPYGNLVDCAYSTASTETLEIPDGQAGDYYMIMINNYANCDGIISFEQVSGEGSSDCTIVAPPVSNDGPYCVGQDIDLTVNYPVTGATYSWTGPNSFTSTEMNPTITNAGPDDSGTYSLIITVDGVDSDPETTEVVVSNPTPLTTVSTGDFVFRNIGTDWNTASNWLECTAADEYSVSSAVPTSADNVIICAGTTCASNEAIITTAGAICNNLTIETGCLLTMQGAHNLTVHSNWTNNGTYAPGTGTVTFNGTSTVSGTTTSHEFYHITINPAKTVTAPSDNINMYGNWLNNGIFNHNNGTLTLLGSIDQNITSGSYPFYNLTVQNSSAGVNLLDDATVANTLSLVDGILSTGSYNIISQDITTNAITNFSDQSFIYGTLRKYVANGVTYPLPVGKGTSSTDYLRADIISSITGGTNYVDVSVNAITEGSNNIDANLTGTQNGEDLTEVLGEDAIWTIIPDVQPTGAYGIRLFVANIGLDSGDDNLFCVVKRDGASTDYAEWTTLDGSTTIPANDAAGRIYNSGNGYAERTGYTSFSQFSIAKWTSTLPVELISFTGTCKNNTATLSWETYSEINNDYFIVEKSKDMVNFFEFARVDGAGNSNNITSYEVKDVDLFTGNNFYRLKQVDFDGTKETFNTIVINCDKFTDSDALINVYPNPFRSELNIYIENLIDQEINIEILDETGRIVFKESFYITDQIYETSVDLNDLKPAIYYLRLVSDLDVFNTKITKH